MDEPEWFGGGGRRRGGPVVVEWCPSGPVRQSESDPIRFKKIVEGGWEA